MDGCNRYSDGPSSYHPAWALFYSRYLIFLIPNYEQTLKLSDSPRWLISKNRRSDALKALKVFRPKQHVEDGRCELEIIALENSDNMQEKAPWKALFNASNRRRTSIALVIMSLQQLTGVTFSSSYGPTFYKQVGLGDMAFAYAVSICFSNTMTESNSQTGYQQRRLRCHCTHRDVHVRCLRPP